jgi:hypothetical protein
VMNTVCFEDHHSEYTGQGSLGEGEQRQREQEEPIVTMQV